MTAFEAGHNRCSEILQAYVPRVFLRMVGGGDASGPILNCTKHAKHAEHARKSDCTHPFFFGCLVSFFLFACNRRLDVASVVVCSPYGSRPTAIPLVCPAVFRANSVFLAYRLLKAPESRSTCYKCVCVFWIVLFHLRMHNLNFSS